MTQTQICSYDLYLATGDLRQSELCTALDIHIYIYMSFSLQVALMWCSVCKNCMQNLLYRGKKKNLCSNQPWSELVLSPGLAISDSHNKALPYVYTQMNCSPLQYTVWRVGEIQLDIHTYPKLQLMIILLTAVVHTIHTVQWGGEKTVR